MELEYLEIGLNNMTSDKVEGVSTLQGLQYSLMVLVYLCIRDLIKYTIPLIKALIEEKVKEL